jgi:hypothetical protein
MSKKHEGSKGEWAKHLRKYGKRQANKGNRRFSKSQLRKESF